MNMCILESIVELLSGAKNLLFLPISVHDFSWVYHSVFGTWDCGRKSYDKKGNFWTKTDRFFFRRQSIALDELIKYDVHFFVEKFLHEIYQFESFKGLTTSVVRCTLKPKMLVESSTIVISENRHVSGSHYKGDRTKKNIFFFFIAF